MPMETLLTFTVVLGVPLWLAAEEILHRFGAEPGESHAVEPTVAAGPTRRDARQPLETPSHVA